MKILVCLKQVPHKDARLEVRSDGSWIQDENIKFEINAYDTYALEEALRIKDQGEAEVVVACIGPDRVQQSLRTALGMGADRAIHIWDDALASTDSIGVAKALAAAAKDENFDLVLMGLMADDTNHGVTGPYLAELLGLPHITAVVKTELKNGEIVVERELEGGALEVASTPRPCLLAVQTGINEVRYASLKGIMQAKKKPLDKKSLGDLGLTDADVAPRVKVEKIYPPPKGEGANLLQGSPDEVSQQLVTKIKELGLL
ncbi:MAG: electron transfer flavoprotein subunit beta/FixA family protein [Myxococcota bacterium]